MPKLSVVVPCHNVQDFLSDTLRSLANNASSAIEFVLVDDRSTDATYEILDRWQHTLPGARLIRNEQNLGIARSRNVGIDAARGDWITFLDGDDWYAPGHLTRLLSAAESLNCDFVRTDHVVNTGEQRVLKRPPAPREGAVMRPRDVIAPPDAETMVDYPFVWAGVYRRTLFADGGMRFATGLRTAEDRLWIWHLHLRAETCAAVSLMGIFYRRGVATSLTQIADERQLDFIPAFNRLLADVAADREADRFMPKAVRTYCAMLAFHLANADRLEDSVARRLKEEGSAALHAMPARVLERTLGEMDAVRANALRGLHGARRAA